MSSKNNNTFNFGDVGSGSQIVLNSDNVNQAKGKSGMTNDQILSELRKLNVSQSDISELLNSLNRSSRSEVKEVKDNWLKGIIGKYKEEIISGIMSVLKSII